MTKYYNRKHQDQAFEVGEMVLLAGKNIRTKRPSKKLDNKYQGPFEITERVGKNAYRLELPKAWKIHDVFNVALLEKYHKGEGFQLGPIADLSLIHISEPTRPY